MHIRPDQTLIDLLRLTKPNRWPSFATEMVQALYAGGEDDVANYKTYAHILRCDVSDALALRRADLAPSDFSVLGGLIRMHFRCYCCLYFVDRAPILIKLSRTFVLNNLPAAVCSAWQALQN